MGNSDDDTEDVTTPKDGEALPELNPWREVGWIFRDGDCIAIARQGSDAPRPGVLAD